MLCDQCRRSNIKIEFAAKKRNKDGPELFLFIAYRARTSNMKECRFIFSN